jgi:hypothetical protein
MLLSRRAWTAADLRRSAPARMAAAGAALATGVVVAAAQLSPVEATPSRSSSAPRQRASAAMTRDSQLASAEGGGYLYGLTLTDVSDIDGIVTLLKVLPRRTTVRIVFDGGRRASDYRRAIQAIHPYADIMGQVLDSSEMKSMSVDSYRRRTQEYVTAFGSRIAIWEIGNEVNGEWLGSTRSVVKKIQAAHDVVKAAKGKTALTLYYNHGCWSQPENEMFRWVSANLPESLRTSVDHTFISYYESDCNDYRPQSWDAEFSRLRALFPTAGLGFGEVGLPDPVTPRTVAKAKDVMRRYYSLRISTPGYEGGGFWWYAVEDLVGADRPLLPVLHEVWGK